MKKADEQTYTLDEAKTIMAQYLNSSADRLRLRLRNSWKKQVSGKLLTHEQIKV